MMNQKIILLILFSILLLSPIVSLAAPFDAGTRPGTNLNAGTQWLNDLITSLISSIWMLFVAFAIIMFIAAGFLFLKAQGEPAEVGTARKALLWGVIGFAVGILAFLLPFIVRLWIF